jgi:hypothetical protein
MYPTGGVKVTRGNVNVSWVGVRISLPICYYCPGRFTSEDFGTAEFGNKREDEKIKCTNKNSYE